VRPAFISGRDGTFKVHLRVVDSNGLTATDTADVIVLNVLPRISLEPIVPSPEGTLVVVRGIATDPGWLDHLTGRIQTGDGTPARDLGGRLENFRPDATLRFEDGYRYGENGSYRVTVCVDDGTAPACVDRTAEIANAAPIVSTEPDRTVFEGDTVSLSTTFTDAGRLDTHTAEISWGDGVTEPGVVSEVAGSGSVIGSHVYARPGVYTVSVSVRDDDGAVDVSTFPVTVGPGFFRFCLYGERTTSPGVLVRPNSIVNCGVGSNGNLQLNQATVTGNLFSLGGNVVLSQASRIRGETTALGDVTLAALSQVRGNARAGGDVVLRANSRLEGNATAGGVVRIAPSAVVTGTVVTGAPPPTIPPMSPLFVAPSTSGANVVVPPGGNLILPPGEYGRVTVGARGVLRLQEGTYAFESFTVRADGIVTLELRSGPIDVNVGGAVSFGPRVQMSLSGLPADNVLFRVGGSVTLAGGGNYVGTYVAPNGRIVVGDTTILRGALFGEWVELGRNVDVFGFPALRLYLSTEGLP